MEEFYITLPSNVKNDLYENTVANFKTKLASSINLEGNWRVGISSISYTKSWSVEEDIALFHIPYFDRFNFHNLEDETFKIDISQFKSVEEIIDELNEILEEFEIYKTPMLLPKFEINKTTNRVNIIASYNRNAILLPRISENLCKVLGFDKDILDNFITMKHNEYRHQWNSIRLRDQWNLLDTWMPKAPNPAEKIYIANFPYNISPDFYSIYVYCDLVKHSFVGDSFSQLLRIIEVPPGSKFRDQILFNYSNIHYIPLRVNEFNTIEIHLKDDQNKTIPFKFGRTIISLHFKKLIKEINYLNKQNG